MTMKIVEQPDQLELIIRIGKDPQLDGFETGAKLGKADTAHFELVEAFRWDKIQPMRATLLMQLGRAYSKAILQLGKRRRRTKHKPLKMIAEVVPKVKE
jgi:hypothetical protein